jgi:hypothetical protein
VQAADFIIKSSRTAADETKIADYTFLDEAEALFLATKRKSRQVAEPNRNGAMMLQHLKELDRSTGRRYGLGAGRAVHLCRAVAWRGGLCLHGAGRILFGAHSKPSYTVRAGWLTSSNIPGARLGSLVTSQWLDFMEYPTTEIATAQK